MKTVGNSAFHTAAIKLFALLIELKNRSLWRLPCLKSLLNVGEVLKFIFAFERFACHCIAAKLFICAQIHCSQLFPWPIYSQSTALFQRLKQIANVRLATQQFNSQISFKNLDSRKIIKIILLFVLFCTILVWNQI